MMTTSCAVLVIVGLFSGCMAKDIECPDGICKCTDDVDSSGSPELLSQCTNANLTDIPEGLDNNTVVVDLSDNNIERLRNDSFNNNNTILVNLNRVFLKRNKIYEIEPGAFSILTSLSELDLESNLIGNISQGTFSNNTDLIILNLGNNSLSSLPVDVITLKNHLRELDVSDNSISKVDAYIIKKYYPELQRLDISKNKISHFYTSSPIDHSSLEVIDISNNYIAELDPSTFSNMSKLKELNVSNNELTDLGPDIFANNPDLVKVDISRNHIFAIHRSAFSRNPEMKEIHAGYNNLTYLHRDTFGNNPQLTNVIVSWNNVEDIDPNTFSRNPKLESVDLKSNKLKSLHPDTFQNNPELRYLDLRSNSLVTVYETTFHKNPKLEHLFVSKNEHIRLHNGFLIHATTLKVFDAQHCNLSELPPDLFNKSDLRHLNLGNNNLSSLDGVTTNNTGYIDTLTKLEVLNLANNRLQTVKVEVFTNNLTQLKTLHIDGNPFLCDCDLRNAWLWSQKEGIIPSEPSIMCKDAQNNSIHWNNVQNLTCSDEMFDTSEPVDTGVTSLPIDATTSTYTNTTRVNVIYPVANMNTSSMKKTHPLGNVSTSAPNIEWYDLVQDKHEPNPKIVPSKSNEEDDRSNKIMIGVSLFVLLAVVLIVLPLLFVMRKKYGTYKVTKFTKNKNGKMNNSGAPSA